MKKIITISLIGFLFIIPILLVVLPHKTVLDGENRKAASFPDNPKKLRSRTIKKYFNGIDSFFSDNIVLRPYLAPMAFSLKQDILNDNVNVNICMRGTDDWLFLGNDYGNTIEKRLGVYNYSNAKIKEGIQNIRSAKTYADSIGAEFIVVIGPDKGTIYPEFLPNVFKAVDESFSDMLVSRIRQAGVKIYDPTKDLYAIKHKKLLYYRTDTHWNYISGYEVFTKLSKLLQLPPLPALSFTPGPAYRGDLLGLGAYTSFSLHENDNYLIEWKGGLPEPTTLGHCTINPIPTLNKTVLIVGDSFATALMPFITRTFAKTYRYHYRGSSFEDFSKIDTPDIILVVCVQRELNFMLGKIGKVFTPRP